jgi:hypothetical protein
LQLEDSSTSTGAGGGGGGGGGGGDGEGEGVPVGRIRPVVMLGGEVTWSGPIWIGFSARAWCGCDMAKMEKESDRSAVVTG